MKLQITKDERKYLKRLGETIKEKRKELDISQDLLAKAIGLNRGQIIRVEAGTTTSSVITLLRIAQSLEIGLGEIVDV